MKLEIGKLLIKKDVITEDFFAEITGYNNRTNKWHLEDNEEYSVWLTKEEIERDFKEINETT